MLSDHLVKAWQQGVSYEQYRNTIGSLLVQNRTTGNNQSEAYIHYTRMNAHRMKRLDKTITLQPTLVAALRAIRRPQQWLVLNEAWCGDGANSIPVMAVMAAHQPLISLRIAWRDEHPELIDEHLTDGGRAIPKLICFDTQHDEIIATWGPRPAPLQALRKQWIAAGVHDWDWIAESIQKWYNQDKTTTLQQELQEVVHQCSQVYTQAT